MYGRLGQSYESRHLRGVRSFANIRSFGCHSHYGQALVKKAGARGLVRELRSPGDTLKKFLAFGALPLLPAEHIDPVFALCAEEALATDARLILFGVRSSDEPA